MTLKEAAQIYVDLVRLEESLISDQQQAREEVTILRSKYHDLFAEALRAEGIHCPDRFEAAQRAFELVASSAMATSDECDYTTTDGRRYHIGKTTGWQWSGNQEGSPRHRCWWVAVDQNNVQAQILFRIDCDTFFERVYDKPGEMPQELATWSIFWLLEEDKPPSDSSYRGVFERQGLRHRVAGPIDEQFGRARCPQLSDLVDQVTRKWMEARRRERHGRIGFHQSSNEFWTQHQSATQQV